MTYKPARPNATPLPTDTIIFFDLETGGTEDHHPTIQLAAVAIDASLPDWPVQETFERKVQFDIARCDPEALELNHFKATTWGLEAISAEQVRTEFKPFLNRHKTLALVSAAGNNYTTTKVAGHNIIRFDLPRLDRLFGKGFKPYAWWRALDTLVLASWVFDGGLGGAQTEEQPKNLRLETLCEFFGIDTEGAHDALADVHQTIELAKALTRHARGKI